MNFQNLSQEADQIGLRLEIVKGSHIWEMAPTKRHQKAVDVIRDSIDKAISEQSCECVHYADVYIKFYDGSYKRPDISIFCSEPEEEDEAITMIPEAVIEIISQGYEEKDVITGPNFYLSQGVKDVVVFDPRTLAVLHLRKDKVERLTSEVKILLECGCEIEV